MQTVQVKDILKDQILVSRESARVLEDALRTRIAGATGCDKTAGVTSLIIDFAGVSGIAPSFLDELLSVFESIIRPEVNGREWELIVAHPPTRLSLKFQAIARGRGMSIGALADGSWVLKGIEDKAKQP